MNGRAGVWTGWLCSALSWTAASAAEERPPQAEQQPASAAAREILESTTKAAPADPAGKACVNQCNIADGKCNSAVRRARQECSRNAASSGRNPMTMRNNDYTYFCSYFRNPGRRGPGNFDARFTGHYNLCIDVMQQNVASMRYDCYRNERDTQNICRTELRDCKSACQ